MNKRKLVSFAFILFAVLLFLPFVQNFILDVVQSGLHRNFGKPEKWCGYLKFFGICSFITGFYIHFFKDYAFFNLKINSTEEWPLKVLLSFVFATSFVVIMFCSESSFIYPINIWDDANCYLTVGRTMFKGGVLYQDIFEQKALYYYLLHVFASFISYKTFLGVFVWEIFSATVFLFFSYKTLRLFTSKNVLFLLPLFLAICFSSQNFQYGDTAEEFSLCILSYPLYVTIKNVKLKLEYSKKELILTGLCSGILLWTKFTLLGMFLGWAIIPVFIYLKEKKYKKMGHSILYILYGVIIATVPVFIYHIATNSLKDLFQVYFYNNLFVYSSEDVVQSGFISKILTMVKYCIKLLLAHFAKDNLMLLVLLLVSVCTVFRECCAKNRLNILFMFASTSFFIFAGGLGNKYYSVTLDLFLIFSLIPLNNFFENFSLNFNKSVVKGISYSACAIVSILIVIFMPFHKEMRFVKKDDLAQYKFSKIINSTEDNSILNYGCLDDGFYLAAGVLPPIKYFCGLNVQVPEVMEGQNDIVLNGKTQYIVARQKELPGDKYELIANEETLRPDKKGEIVHYLFKRK